MWNIYLDFRWRTSSNFHYRNKRKYLRKWYKIKIGNGSTIKNIQLLNFESFKQ